MKKSLIVRIAILALAGLMILGIVASSLYYILA